MMEKDAPSIPQNDAKTKKQSATKNSRMSTLTLSKFRRYPSVGCKASSVKERPQPKEEVYTDENRIFHAVREAGRYAEGIAAVEVWVLEDLHLVQPDGGWYRDPKFKSSDQDALDRIEDKSRKDYVSPPPQLPGVGLAGGLWTANDDETLAAHAGRNLLHWGHHQEESGGLQDPGLCQFPWRFYSEF